MADDRACTGAGQGSTCVKHRSTSVLHVMSNTVCMQNSGLQDGNAHSCVVFWQRRVHKNINLCAMCVALVHVVIGSAECGCENLCCCNMQGQGGQETQQMATPGCRAKLQAMMSDQHASGHC
jgi:hypothetical protein